MVQHCAVAQTCKEKSNKTNQNFAVTDERDMSSSRRSGETKHDNHVQHRTQQLPCPSASSVFTYSLNIEWKSSASCLGYDSVCFVSRPAHGWCFSPRRRRGGESPLGVLQLQRFIIQLALPEKVVMRVHGFLIGRPSLTTEDSP